MSVYVTTTTERLDLICWRHYGHLRGTVEAVLAHRDNAALCGHDIAGLPPGITIVLVDTPSRPMPPPRRF